MDAPHATETIERDYVEVTRLAEKLMALRERLLYSYFGAGELRALRRVLYDLQAILERYAPEEEGIHFPLQDARISAAEAIEMVKELHAEKKAGHRA